MKIALRKYHQALAVHALAYTHTVKSINAYADVEMEADHGVALVYAGRFSPIHGAYGYGVDGEIDQALLQHIEDFFTPTERSAHIYLPEEAEASQDFLRAHQYKEEIIPIYQWNQKFSEAHSDHHFKELHLTDLNQWAQIASSCFTGSREADLLRTIQSHMPQSKFYLSYADNKAVAASSYFLSQSLCLLQGSATHSQYRKKGHFRNLLQARLRSSAAAGADAIYIHPLFSKQENSTFLEKLGFQKVSQTHLFTK